MRFGLGGWAVKRSNNNKKLSFSRPKKILGSELFVFQVSSNKGQLTFYKKLK